MYIQQFALTLQNTSIHLWHTKSKVGSTQLLQMVYTRTGSAVFHLQGQLQTAAPVSNTSEISVPNILSNNWTI